MDNNLITLEQLRGLRSINLNKRIVFTNGCFDILHRGHLVLLQNAKAFGDILVVGVNSDASVRALKGELRPIISDIDRAFMISGIRVVDYVYIFDDLSPVDTIAALRPDVHVKGGDYVAENLPEYETVRKYGGRIEIVSYVDGYSTSSLLHLLQYE